MKKKNNRYGFTLLEIMLVVAIIGLLAVIAIPAVIKARNKSQANVCISNLRQIDSAKEQWAMLTGKRNGSAVVVSEVDEFIKGGNGPSCPAGGTYDYTTIGTNPVCDKPGHEL